MQEIIYIYKLTFPNGKAYIGKTIDSPISRFYAHCAQAYSNRRDNQPCQDAIVKYGVENIVLEVIEETYDPSREDYWIRHYSEKGLYNIVGNPERRTPLREDHMDSKAFLQTIELVKQNLGVEMSNGAVREMVMGINWRKGGEYYQLSFNQRVAFLEEEGYRLRGAGIKSIDGKRIRYSIFS